MRRTRDGWPSHPILLGRAKLLAGHLVKDSPSLLVLDRNSEIHGLFFAEVVRPEPEQIVKRFRGSREQKISGHRLRKRTFRSRLPLLANFITCFVIYVIGNLTSPLVASTKGNNELVGFVGKLIAVVVPNLNVFNVQSAVDAGNPIPVIYLAGAFNYLVCFAIAIWMLAMLLFEDRDLA